MVRRDEYLVLSATVILYSLTSCISGSRKELIKHPNVLFIAVDDLNDWTGPLGGHPQAVTSNLARLAGEGVCFNHACYFTGNIYPFSETGILPGISGRSIAANSFQFYDYNTVCPPDTRL